MTSFYAAQGFFINADSVEIVQEWPTRMAEREKRRASGRGQFYDACRGKPIRCLITLKSGWVIASPHSPETLISRPQVRPPVKASVRNSPPQEKIIQVGDFLSGANGEVFLEDATPLTDANGTPQRERKTNCRQSQF